MQSYSYNQHQNYNFTTSQPLQLNPQQVEQYNGIQQISIPQGQICQQSPIFTHSTSQISNTFPYQLPNSLQTTYAPQNQALFYYNPIQPQIQNKNLTHQTLGGPFPSVNISPSATLIYGGDQFNQIQIQNPYNYVATTKTSNEWMPINSPDSQNTTYVSYIQNPQPIQLEQGQFDQNQRNISQTSCSYNNNNNTITNICDEKFTLSKAISNYPKNQLYPCGQSNKSSNNKRKLQAVYQENEEIFSKDGTSNEYSQQEKVLLRDLNLEKKQKLNNSQAKNGMNNSQFDTNNFHMQQTTQYTFEGEEWIEKYLSNNELIKELCTQEKPTEPNEKQTQTLEKQWFQDKFQDSENQIEYVNYFSNEVEQQKNSFKKPQILPHLLLRKIFRQFCNKNMQKINLPKLLRSKLQEVLDQCSSYLTKIDKNHRIKKLYVYSHTHYNLLFLNLTPISLKQLMSMKNKMDIEIHEHIFGIKMSEDIFQNNSKMIQYINFIKKCLFTLAIKFVRSNKEKEEFLFHHYQEQAFKAIQMLVRGNLIQRF